MLSEVFDIFDDLHGKALAALRTFVGVVSRPDESITISTIENQIMAFSVELSWHASFFKYLIELSQRLEDMKLVRQTLDQRTSTIESVIPAAPVKHRRSLLSIFSTTTTDDAQRIEPSMQVQGAYDDCNFIENFNRRVIKFNTLRDGCVDFLSDRMMVLAKAEFLIKEHVVHLSRRLQTAEGLVKREIQESILHLENKATAVGEQRARLNWLARRIHEVRCQPVSEIPETELV